MKKLIFVVYMLPMFFLSGCMTPNASGQQYASADLTNTAPTVDGIVVSKRLVQVQGDSEIGGLAGTATGAIAGSGIGGGRGQWLGAIGGAVIGGMAGSAIQKRMTGQQAYEYIVRINPPQKFTSVEHNQGRGDMNFSVRSGSSQKLVTVVQSDANFSVNDRVFVILSTKPRIVKNMSNQ